MNINPRHQGLVDTAIWLCIYGGLLSIVISVALEPDDGDIAFWLACVGSLVTAVGIGLIYIRSRMK